MPTTFYESPMSYQLVKQGKLPPINERLPVPEDVLVVNPTEDIGVYGGTWQIQTTAMWMGVSARGHFAKRDHNEFDYIPEVGKAFGVSADGRTWTMTLRRGAKWADGAPFTMDDIRFAWEDINFNTKINPTVDEIYKDPITGNLVKFAVVDDQNWTLTYDSPMHTLFEGKQQRGMRCKGGGNQCWFAPKHVLSKYHATYADPAALQKEIQANEVADFVQLWTKKAQITHTGSSGEIPCMGPWCTKPGTVIGTDEGTLERNHFSIYVDPEGNQIPYTDELQHQRAESREVAVFRSMNGNTDSYTEVFSLQEVPLYMANMAKGDYSLEHWPTTGGSDAGIVMNQTYNEDKEIGRLIRTRDFRRALSAAIDRDTINEVVFLGIGVPQNWAPHPSTPYYPGPEYANKDIKRDLDLANQLLDSAGLKTNAAGQRLRSDDGQPLMLQAVGLGREDVDVFELVADQLADVGIGFTFRSTREAYSLYRAGSEYMNVHIDLSAYQANPWAVTWTQLVPIKQTDLAPKIGLWNESGGKKGMGPGSDPSFLPVAPASNFPADPSGNLKKLIDLWEEGRTYSQVSPERIKLGKEIYQIHVDEQYFVSTVAFTGSRRGVQLHRNNFRNVPETAVRDTYGFWRETYFFEDGSDNLHHIGNKSTLHKSTSFLAQ